MQAEFRSKSLVLIIATLLTLPALALAPAKEGGPARGDPNGEVLAPGGAPDIGAAGEGGPPASRATGLALNVLAEGEGGDQLGDYGAAVLNPGDLNGDGVDDMVVGNPSLDTVYIFFGRARLALEGISPGASNVTITGENLGDHFGTALASGDFNKDGNVDLVVGAPDFDSLRGKLYVFSGGAWENMTAADADATLAGRQTGVTLGAALAGGKDFNGDKKHDLAVGVPADDRVYILNGSGSSVLDVTGKLVLTGPGGSDFGSALLSPGDLDGDGLGDIIVGAPEAAGGTGVIHMYLGDVNASSPWAHTDSNLTMGSQLAGARYGAALGAVGDINDDGLRDFVVGAPGVSKAFVYLGNSSITRYLRPYLWDHPDDTDTPEVDFTSGVYNDAGIDPDVNTFGPGAGDDGWDWMDDPYLCRVKNGNPTADMTTIYGSQEGDADGVTPDGSRGLALEIGNKGYQTEIGDSGAWGIQFAISKEMVDAMNNGGKVEVVFNYTAADTGPPPNQGTEEPVYIKARFGNKTSLHWLGTDQDAAIHGGYPSANTSAEVWFHYTTGGNMAPFTTQTEKYVQDVSSWVDGTGNYYLELGGIFDGRSPPGGQLQGPTEGLWAYFDDVEVRAQFVLPPHAIIDGGEGDEFGAAVGPAGDVNGDGVMDLFIGSPQSEAGGTLSGSAFIYYLTKGSMGALTHLDPDKRMNGEEDAMLGSAGTWVGDVNGDGADDLLICAPESPQQGGMVYLYSAASAPELILGSPLGGEVLGGVVWINATVDDADDNVRGEGVEFFYRDESAGRRGGKGGGGGEGGGSSTGGEGGGTRGGRAGSWTSLGPDPTPNPVTGNYTMAWDTAGLPDGPYSIRLVVWDTSFFSDQDTSGQFELDNPDPPVVKFRAPEADTTLKGDVEIAVEVTDPDGDQKHSVGLWFSRDGSSWSLLLNITDWEQLGTSNILVFTHLWDSQAFPDGELHFKAVARDSTGLKANATVGPMTIDNPDTPVVSLTRPVSGEELSGRVELEAQGWDADDDLDAKGARFLYAGGDGGWEQIGSDSNPTWVDGKWTYSKSWDTDSVPNGVYDLRVNLSDNTRLFTVDTVSAVVVKNPVVPDLAFTSPTGAGGDLFGNVTVKLRLSSAEWFAVGQDGITLDIQEKDGPWEDLTVIITPEDDQGLFWEAQWDSASVPDGVYRFRATASTDDGAVSWLVYSVNFTVDNPDPPTIHLRDPQAGDVLKGVVRLRAQAIDKDSDLHEDGVLFYYSADGADWLFIGERKTPRPDSNDFEYEWDTTRVPDGDYFLTAGVKDTTLLSSRSEVINITILNAEDSAVGGTSAGAEDEALSMMDLLLILVALVVVIGITLVLVLTRQSKKRQARMLRAELVAEQGPDVTYVSPDAGPTLGTPGAVPTQMLAAPGAGGGGGVEPSLLLPSAAVGVDGDVAASGGGVEPASAPAPAPGPVPAPAPSPTPAPAGEATGPEAWPAGPDDDNPFMFGAGGAGVDEPGVADGEAGGDAPPADGGADDLPPPPEAPERDGEAAASAGGAGASKRSRPRAKPRKRPPARKRPGSSGGSAGKGGGDGEDGTSLGTLPGEG